MFCFGAEQSGLVQIPITGNHECLTSLSRSAQQSRLIRVFYFMRYIGERQVLESLGIGEGIGDWEVAHIGSHGSWKGIPTRNGCKKLHLHIKFSGLLPRRIGQVKLITNVTRHSANYVESLETPAPSLSPSAILARNQFCGITRDPGAFFASLCNLSKKVTSLPPFPVSVSVPDLDLLPELGFRTMSHIPERTIPPSVYVFGNTKKSCQLTPLPMGAT
ncbi:uncharacterized protein LACBIDRAFT_324626 [Laccaria bicolor S238N-H82]|uniref:Predicted protein n=1 Tax=Laccaria bicolor (strain S238N-H82 / ATCC MYA-4686) TaxID=486041 RepID=B0D2I7_LACBS|nr:uncharacterized protein LACBIDRAFT_324626 [Laccaria bicolor S238N-H82]EDR11104.1 predicted protein [Laccaria bicolor S238N-H82]|eukprot:XP_001878405.1 predicted protein [Laccaria bicolor S238N-H82]